MLNNWPTLSPCSPSQHGCLRPAIKGFDCNHRRCFNTQVFKGFRKLRTRALVVVGPTFVQSRLTSCQDSFAVEKSIVLFGPLSPPMAGGNCSSFPGSQLNSFPGNTLHNLYHWLTSFSSTIQQEVQLFSLSLYCSFFRRRQRIFYYFLLTIFFFFKYFFLNNNAII